MATIQEIKFIEFPDWHVRVEGIPLGTTLKGNLKEQFTPVLRKYLALYDGGMFFDREDWCIMMEQETIDRWMEAYEQRVRVFIEQVEIFTHDFLKDYIHRGLYRPVVQFDRLLKVRQLPPPSDHGGLRDWKLTEDVIERAKLCREHNREILADRNIELSSFVDREGINVEGE